MRSGVGSLKRIAFTASMFLGVIVALGVVLALGEFTARAVDFSAGAFIRGLPVPPGFLSKSGVLVPTELPQLGFVPAPVFGSERQDGFMGPRLDGERGPHEVRVFVLGDSVTAAPSDGGAGWVGEVRGALQAQCGEPYGVTVQVVNAAVVAYNLTEIAANYRHRVAHERPDVVVYALFANDFNGSVAYPVYHPESFVQLEVPAWFERLMRVRAFGEPLAKRSMLYERVVVRIAYGLHARQLTTGEAGRCERGLRRLDGLRDEVVRDGARFVLMPIPSMASDYSAEPARCHAVGQYDEFACKDDALSYGCLARGGYGFGGDGAGGGGVRVVDVRDVFAGGDTRALRGHVDDPAHPNREGHRRIARGATGALTEEVCAVAKTRRAAER